MVWGCCWRGALRELRCLGKCSGLGKAPWSAQAELEPGTDGGSGGTSAVLDLCKRSSKSEHATSFLLLCPGWISHADSTPRSSSSLAILHSSSSFPEPQAPQALTHSLNIPLMKLPRALDLFSSKTILLLPILPHPSLSSQLPSHS